MPGREDIFQKAMNEGHSAAWDQEWSKAASAYRHALQEMPDHPKALNSLGLALFQQSNYEEALQMYKRVAQVTPQDPVPMEKLAQLLERTGHLKEAVNAAFKAADLYLNQRDVDKATPVLPSRMNASVTNPRLLPNSSRWQASSSARATWKRPPNS
jgi:tetratricopeptide (TPR) repeat protein